MTKAIVGVGIILLGSCALAQDNVAESPYLPAKVGTTWTYKSGEKRVVAKVTKHEKQGNSMCARVEWSSDAFQAFEHIAVTSNGLSRVAINGKASKTPALFLKLPPKDGESWTVDTEIDGEIVKGTFTAGKERVKVPAGEFDAVTSKGDFQVNNKKGQFNYWFAENKGIVKMEWVIDANKITLELEKFEEGN